MLPLGVVIVDARETTKVLSALGLSLKNDASEASAVVRSRMSSSP
jgi:hypothetical protein